MSLSKFESEVNELNASCEHVYGILSDLKNFESLRDMMQNPQVLEQIAKQAPDKNVSDLQQYLSGLTFTSDTLTIASPMGAVVLHVVEREAPKLVKLASEGGPIPLYMWLQLVPQGESASKLRVTIGAEINFMMKAMVSKPLKQAADGFASMLAMFVNTGGAQTQIQG